MSDEIDITEIPEVLDYMDARERLETFRLTHAKVMEEYAGLCDQYNTTLQAADKAVRERRVSCGPFEQLSPMVKVHGDRLYNAVGRVEFLKLGGTITTVPTYAIDRKIFEAAVARKAVPDEIVPLVREVIVKYKTIPKAVLP